jgi:hypothetical protein
MRHARMLLLSLFVVALAGPTAAAQAANPPIWHDGDAAAPTNVTFHAVAAYSPSATGEDVVLAVGDAPGTDGTKQAVIYRRTGGAWVQDQVDQTPIAGSLTEVAMSGPNLAWAAGTKNDGTPLVLHLTTVTDATTGTATLQWTPAVNATAITGAPTALALLGSKGYIGDSNGTIRSIDDTTGQVGAAIAYQPAAASPPSLKPVNAIAYTADPANTPTTSPPTPFATAVGDGSVARIFGIANDGTTDGAYASPFQPDPNPAPVIDIGAAAGLSPLAIESHGMWAPDGPNGTWRRQALPTAIPGDANLRAVSEANGLTAIAGDIANRGEVWTRTALTWTAIPGPAGVSTPLEDVAVVRSDDVWAVGPFGVVIRYSVLPQRDTGGSGGTGGGNPPPDTGSNQPSSSNDNGTPQVTITQQPAPGSRPAPATRPNRPTATESVMRGVRVRVFRGRVVIYFRLVKRARVSARALRGRKLVGVAAARLMKAGRGSLVLRYRGAKPPNQLQIVVRPVGGAGR